MRKQLLVVTALSAALSSACSNAVGCDFREAEGGLQEDRCQERRGFQQFGFQQFCEGLGGTGVEGGCPAEGMVGGCDEGGDVVDFFYEPITLEEVEADCEGTVVQAEDAEQVAS